MQDPPHRPKKRSVIFIVIAVSLGVHIFAGGILAVIKITEILRQEVDFEAPVIDLVMPPPPPPPPPPTTTRTQKSMPRPQPLAAQNPLSLDVPKIEIDRSNMNMLSGRGFGGGLGKIGGGVMDAITSISLFGTQVTTGGLAVILDISGSAHDYLAEAIAEVDRNFSDAPMVLVVGCGMSDGNVTIKKGVVPGKPRIVPYNSRGSNKEYDSFERSGPGQLEQFFRKLGKDKGDEEVRAMRAYFKKRNNLYLLYGGDVLATNFAFDYLLEEKSVDTIYWFADFADEIDKGEIKSLTGNLTRDRVKVIAHNFFGKPVREDVKELVRKTGGQTIEVIPGKR